MSIILFGDYHTHSNFSGDSKTPLEQNIITAIDKGLKEIAVTDHGIKHKANGMIKKSFLKQVELVNELRQKYPQIKILQSMEANLLGRSGNLDVDEVLPYLDFLMMGFHATSKPESLFSFFYFNLPALVKIFKPSKRTIEKNTTAYLKCIEKYPLTFVNHLNYKMPILIRPIAKLCKETNTLVELNGKRVLFSPQEIEILLEEEVNFVVNSDAHTYEKIGDISHPLKFIEEYNIPLERIKNINQALPLKPIKK